MLLCFGISQEMQNDITKALKASHPEVWRQCPLGVYSILVPVITRYFDDALWEFRTPIRDIEKVSYGI